MNRFPIAVAMVGLCASVGTLSAVAAPLGLPEVVHPEDNPTSPEKVALGERLYNDTRFSSDGTIACASCHAPDKGFSDGLKTSKGVGDQEGTRNAPTVLNAAYMETQFWDGRSPSLEDQALHPFLNPIEMDLDSHDQIIEIVQEDRDYKKAFKKVWGVGSKDITIDLVVKSIAAFERTVVAGDSPFDHWFYGGVSDAMTPQQIEGYEIFIGKGRCVSCHVIEQTQATFTDNQFHNIGVGVNRIQDRVPELAQAYIDADHSFDQMDEAVLTDPDVSELGRFAVTEDLDGIGAFKTSTVRNVTVTGPYMHDGSLATLEEVVTHYNNGGVTNEDDPVNDFLAGGIRPLNLTDAEQAALVAFMEALTSPEHAPTTEE